MKSYAFWAAIAALSILLVSPDAAMAAVGHASSLFGSLSDPVVAASLIATAPREFGRKEDDREPTAPREEKEIQAELKTALDEVKKFAEDANKKFKDGEELNKEMKESVDKSLVKLAELRAEMTEMAQKQSRPSGGEPVRKSLGYAVAEQDAVKEFAAKGAIGTIRIDRKAITSATGSAGDLIVVDRQSDMVELPRRRLTVRDLIMPGRTDSNMIEYPKQLARTNAAAPVAENTAKAESDYTWTVATAPVRTIAHWVPVSRQAMDDVPQLASLIDGELRYGLDLAEEAQLLSGAGTGQNLHGLIPQATAYSAPIDPPGTETSIDQLRLAILQVELAEFPANGIVMHPSDWALIELTKTTEGAYIFANPTRLAGPTLWGQPVVPTQAITIDKFLVGAFNMAAQIFDRMATEVLISSEDRDNFIKNMLTVRAEKRLALAVKRPAALVYGDYGRVV